MSRFTGNRNRVARRFGVNIFGRARNPLLHKPNAPGMHGARRKKKSDYGVQLEEKQKLKALYGMLSEKQLINYYKKAAQKQADTAQTFAELLESRLDNIVYRLKFASTIFGAHQLVSHGHILVNGKKVDRRSFHVKPGMTISVKEGSRKMKCVQESLDNGSKEVPSYLTLDRDQCSGQLLAPPTQDLMPWPIELNLHEICDFLAHTS
jgi:small subunit ribosomal protein S4